MKISSAFTSLSLKMVGGVIVISSLFDYLFLAIPFTWQNPDWQINFTNQIVDRGIVPLVGMAFLIAGWWITDAANTNNNKVYPAVRIPIFVLASLLGLMFLLLVPVHLSNISKASSVAIAQIEAQAGQQATRVQGFIQQLNTISQNPAQLSQEIAGRNQVIETGSFQGRQLSEPEIQALKGQRDQLQQLLDLSKNPKELKQRLDALRGTLETRLKELQLEQKSKAKTVALKQSLNTGISSLMLAIGYIVIGWLGLKNIGTTNKKILNDTQY